jgi:Mn2+/Fe2+ NRAMP family transporter
VNRFFRLYGPGILLAATGVGAGDLVTAGLSGVHLGYGVLWACLIGAFLKWGLNEGLARYQFATGETLLEGWVKHLGSWVGAPFFIYLIIWSFFVGGALINACAVAGANIWQLGLAYSDAKIFWGIFHSLLGLMLVLNGNFQFFEKIMSFLVGVMFLTVIVSAILLIEDYSSFFRGLFYPSLDKKNLSWALAILGGVGGTLTVLSYGYWIKESQRSGSKGLSVTRKDLALSYTLTALFSISMIIIGTSVGEFDGVKGKFPLYVAQRFAELWGEKGRYLFLFGFWGGVFSSLMGVWQSVPYLFADFMRIRSGADQLRVRQNSHYRYFLFSIALFPILTLWFKFERIQILYALLGAFFMPMLALTLLILNNQKKIVGKYVSSWFFNVVCIFTLLLFSYLSLSKLLKYEGQ